MPIKLRTRPISIPGQKVIEAALNSFRIAVESFVRELNQCPFITGSLIEDIELTASATYRINHKLGKKPQGYFITRVTETYFLYKEIESTDTYLDLYSYTSATISIWFF